MSDIITGVLLVVGILAFVGSALVYAYMAYEVIKSHDDLVDALAEDEEDEA